MGYRLCSVWGWLIYSRPLLRVIQILTFLFKLLVKIECCNKERRVGRGPALPPPLLNIFQLTAVVWGLAGLAPPSKYPTSSQFQPLNLTNNKSKSYLPKSQQRFAYGSFHIGLAVVFYVLKHFIYLRNSMVM